MFVGDKKAGIKWNVLSRYSGHPLSAILLKGLLKMRENKTEWAAILEKLSTSPTTLEFPEIFALCYNDLPLHLRSCLICLASFPEDIEIPTKKLFHMWIAAGFVIPKHDDDQSQTKENVASAYLTELVQRGMVIVRKRRAERVKTCQLKFALRDLCLERAKEEHILKIVDQFEDTISITNCASNAKLKTQQLAIHLDQYSPTPELLDERLRFLENISSPISLLVFSDLHDPLHNDDKWEWLLYLCKHWQLLRVLDVERMWMTKGSLPKEIGNLRQIRYLSLKGTWVTKLPTSVEYLINLETLDLRVMGSISIPDVLWKLSCLMHLYLPEAYQLAETEMKLQLSGMKFLQTLVNLDTYTVCLSDLVELKLLRKLSIRKIHAVDEFDDILKSLSPSLDLCFDSNIINHDSTILSSFRNMHKVKIKGEFAVKLAPEMFPPDLEELTLKHTMLKNDPLVVLEKLPKLTKLSLEHGSFIGETMTLSDDFHDRAFLTLCALGGLNKLYLPYIYSRRVETIDCWLLTKEFLSHRSTCLP